MDKFFGMFSPEGVVVKDPTLAQFINLNPIEFPHSHGRHGKKGISRRSKVSIVERLANALMRGGTGRKILGRVIRTHGQMQGKKLKALTIVRDALVIIERETKQNPLQVLVDALINAAPREDVTYVSYGGIRYQVAVDVSASRRVDIAIRNLALGSILASFNTPQPMSEVLAREIMLAAKADPSSYAIKRKEEIERIARGAR